MNDSGGARDDWRCVACHNACSRITARDTSSFDYSSLMKRMSVVGDGPSFLTDIPTEILLLVINSLRLCDLLSLRVVSKGFLASINPRVFAHVSFILGYRQVSKLSLVESISTSSSNIAYYVKTLRIGSLDLVLNPNASTPGFTRDSTNQTDRNGTELNEDIVRVLLSEHLAPALTKLQNLSTVE